ncbi:hypothetical protein BT69DRAFT_1340540 [Atractiella rhizophila]|nr:hypothetical protein BT69DRAFT_1340540 [Atractiella rhizophila]
MRTLITTRQGLVPIFPGILQRLVKIVAVISKNPSNPKFSHYSFESISILIRFVVPANPESLGQFEEALLGAGAPFHSILHEEVWEFVPFVFQIVCQLLDLHKDTIPEFYQTLLPPILQVTLWEQRGNIPALVRLVKTFILREPNAIVANNQLEPVLGIFRSLIANKLNDQYGLDLLEAIFRSIPG